MTRGERAGSPAHPAATEHRKNPASDPAAPAVGAVTGAPRTAPNGTRKAVRLATLLGTAQSIDIVHGEQTYRLQITKAGKLILTK